jgi:hypothetical protein
LLILLDSRGLFFVMLNGGLNYPATDPKNDRNCCCRKDFRDLLSFVEKRFGRLAGWPSMIRSFCHFHPASRICARS